MKPIKPFSEFLRLRIVKKQSPDKSRAGFLIEESERSLEGLNEIIEKIGINKNNVNSIIKDCHDIIMEIIRAKMLLDGYSASGAGAHEAEVSYMRILGFSERDVQFADQLRYFRNGILYYGTNLDGKYAKEVLGFLRRIHPELKEIIWR